MPKLLSAAARFVFAGRRHTERTLSHRERSIPSATPLAMPEALEARTHLSVSQDANGWTVVTPESDTRVIYVSSSQGSDGNTGKSADKPVKSLSKASSLLRDNSSDQMLLKRGDSWNEWFSGWSKSGKSDDQPMVIGAYGSGDRPKLKTGANTAFYAGSHNDPVDHLSIIGLHFSAHTRLPGKDFVSTDGVAGIRLLAPMDDFLMEDCYVEGYRDNILLQAFFGPLTDVTIRRSVIVDAYGVGGAHAQGLYAQGVNGLVLEENIFDHNGWMEGVSGGGGQTGFNHNVYMRADNENVVVRGNVFSRASSHGLQARSGGKIENNLFIDNPIGMSFGLVNGSPATAGGVTGAVKGNVFFGGHATINGSVRGWALEIGNTKPGADTVIESNVFAGDGSEGFPAIVLGVGSNLENRSDTVGINDLTIRNNVIHQWAEGIRLSSGLRAGESSPEGLNGLVVQNNDFQKLPSEAILHDIPFASGSETWSGNRYDSAGGGPEITITYNKVSWDRWKKDRESTGKLTKAKYYAPDRTVGTYSRNQGDAGSIDTFLSTMRAQSSQTWKGAYRIPLVTEYVKNGFTETGSVAAPEPTTPTTPSNPSTPTPPAAPEAPPVDLPTAPVNPDPVPADGVAPTIPTASVDVPAAVAVMAGDAAPLTFTVTYADSAGIDVATLDAADLRVTGRKGFDEPAMLVSVQEVAGAAIATYAVNQPDGAWARANKGTYTVTANPDQVRNVGGVPVEPVSLAEFKVTVTKAPPAEKPPTVKKIRFVRKAGEQSLTVTFTQDVSATIDPADLFLASEAGGRIDPALIAVSYDSTRNAATFTFPGLAGALPEGRYQLTLTGWGIADPTQMLDGDRDGLAGGDYVLKKWLKA